MDRTCILHPVIRCSYKLCFWGYASSKEHIDSDFFLKFDSDFFSMDHHMCTGKGISRCLQSCLLACKLKLQHGGVTARFKMKISKEKPVACGCTNTLSKCQFQFQFLMNTISSQQALLKSLEMIPLHYICVCHCSPNSQLLFMLDIFHVVISLIRSAHLVHYTRRFPSLKPQKKSTKSGGPDHDSVLFQLYNKFQRCLPFTPF